jgi:hypothetical protein
MTPTEVEALAAEHPRLPAVYFGYLRDVGWGASPSGHMVYSGPISPDEIYPQLPCEKTRVLLADDTQGYCLGYDIESQQFGEYSDAGEWSSFDRDFDLAAFLNGNQAP